MTVNECHRKNLCVDCDNTVCWFHGELIADCPKYHCDRPPEQVEDCESCAFLKRYMKNMREEKQNVDVDA